MMSNTVRNLFGVRQGMSLVVLALAGMAWVFSCAAHAAAQESAKDYVEPRLSRPQFTVLTRQLGLDSDQRAIADLMFSDYSLAMDGLTRQLDEQAMEAGLRSVQDVMMGKTRMSQDELRAKRIAVLKVYQQGWPVIDSALDDLLGGLESVLTETQAVHFAPALRELHRDLLLHPRQAGSDYQEYAGDGVDVMLLVESAMKDDGELRGLDPATIQTVLTGYELDLEALIVRSATAYRNSKLLRKIAGIEKNDAALRQLDQESIERWKQLYQLNKSTVEQIGQIAAERLGGPARQRWLDRFDQASFTWLYPRRKPDRQIEWMRQQSLAPDTLTQAEGVYEQYVARRRELSRQAIDIMLRGRLEYQMMLYSMMDPSGIDGNAGRSLYEQLLKNSGEQANLENTTSGTLEGLLSPAQRESMRRAMQGPDRGPRR